MTKTGRRPGPTATRDSILRAARSLFAERGYQRTGLRRIAEVAGVHPALIHYHFGSKQQLYREVLDLPVDPWEVLTRLLDDTPREELPAALLRQFFTTWRDPAAGAHLVALARHTLAADDGLTRAHLESVVIPRFTHALNIDEADAAAAFAVLVGAVLSDAYLGLRALRDMTIDELVATFEPCIRRYLLGPRPPDRTSSGAVDGVTRSG